MLKNNSRQLSVTFITLLVLSITIWNIFRIVSSIRNWSFLIIFDGKPYYILTTGIFWAITALILLYIIYARSRFTQVFANLTGVSYFGWFWFDRLLVQLSPAPNSIFSLLFSGSLLICYLVIINFPGWKTIYLKEQQ